MGIDRLSMLLTDNNNIKVCFLLYIYFSFIFKEVLFFPAMRPEEQVAKEDQEKAVEKQEKAVELNSTC